LFVVEQCWGSSWAANCRGQFGQCASAWGAAKCNGGNNARRCGDDRIDRDAAQHVSGIVGARDAAQHIKCSGFVSCEAFGGAGGVLHDARMGRPVERTTAAFSDAGGATG